MLLVRWRAIVAASLSLVIFSATISVLMGIGSTPDKVLGNPDVYVITSKGSESLLNSVLETRLADQLLENRFVENISPEIFAFAEIGGRAVLIRGVEFDPFMAVEEARIAPGGSMPTYPYQGLIGSRLAERLQTSIGDRYPLVGSFGPSVAEVEITGVIESSTSVEDEMIVSLPLARCLSGTQSGHVSIIRVIGNTTELDKIFGSHVARFSMFDLSIANSTIAKGSGTVIGLSLKNWGDENGTAHIVLRDESANITLLENYSYMPPGGSEELSVEYYFDSVGNHTITAHLDGILPQTISANITVREPYLTAIAQRQVVEHHNFTVQVVNNRLHPAQNSKVTVGGFEFFANSTGYCTVYAPLSPGNYTLMANLSGYEDAVTPITVVNSSTLQQSVLIQVYDLVLTPAEVKVHESCTVAVYVQNFGNISGSSTIKTYFRGVLAGSKDVYLQPLQHTVLYYDINSSTAGDMVISSGSFSETLTVDSNYQVNPEIVQLLLRYGGASSLDPSRGDLLYHTTKISESNIVIVLVSLAVLSAVLVTLGISTSFMKEINDNLKVIGILRSLGASSKQLLGIIFKESILVSIPAAAIGIVGGCAIALAIQSTESLVAFGHLIDPVLDPSFLAAAIVGSIAICIGSGLITGLSVSSRRTIKMIRGQDEEDAKRLTLQELLGED